MSDLIFSPAGASADQAAGNPGGPRPAGQPAYFAVDFDRMPFTVAWEITRACALACVHCRAAAIPRRDPRELTTDEGFRFIDDLVELGKPILIVTGGDPLMRRDVEALVGYAVRAGLRVGLSPSATRLVTRERLARLRDLGLSMVHLSLDGSTAARHDAFRGVAGSFQRTLASLDDVRTLGLPLQIGTTVTRQTRDDLAAVAERVAAAGATVWSVFFLVPTGRGQTADMLDAAEHEAVLEWLHAHAAGAPYAVRTTAAPTYRRVVIQRERRARGLDADAPSTGERWEATGAGYAFRDGAAPTAKGVNDAKGFAFVDHAGNVQPSGFLPLTAANLRDRSIVEIYRDDPLFRALRDPARLKGKCGRCRYREVCGGSRARAYALTGDYLAADPTCAYVPDGSPN